MKDKNEHINLWILGEKRRENRARIQKENGKQNSDKHCCPHCKRGFSEPKIIQYCVCPHCENKFEYDLNAKKGCSHYLGFLATTERNKEIPQECIECKLVLECMLRAQASSQAISEVKKWF